MSSIAPSDGNNQYPNNNDNPMKSPLTTDSPVKSQNEKGKDRFTMGGVKKPKFRPVLGKASNIHKIDHVQIPMVSTSPAVPSRKEETKTDNVATTNSQPQVESTKTTVKEKKPREKTDKPYKKEGEKQNRQNRMQPRFLVSGESRFFATNNVRGSNGAAIDSALMFNRQPGVKKEVKKEEDMEIESNDYDDDHELPAGNNGPIRFPYMESPYTPSDQSNISWDEDEAQVTPLELLRGVNDGELLLFALPSFLPIYTKNREYGIDEEAFTHILDTKPHDYVENELMSVKPGKIGKMRVHESGRITIDINGYIVDMNVSIPLHYQQQVVTIDENNMNILGNVTHRLILTPDIQNFK